MNTACAPDPLQGAQASPSVSPSAVAGSDADTALQLALMQLPPTAGSDTPDPSVAMRVREGGSPKVEHTSFSPPGQQKSTDLSSRIEQTSSPSAAVQIFRQSVPAPNDGTARTPRLSPLRAVLIHSTPETTAPPLPECLPSTATATPESAALPQNVGMLASLGQGASAPGRPRLADDGSDHSPSLPQRSEHSDLGLTSPLAPHIAVAATPASDTRGPDLPPGQQQVAQTDAFSPQGGNGLEALTLSGTHAHLLRHLQQTEMQVHLHAEEFGRVSVHAAYGHDAVSAQITLENNELGSALVAHMPEMERALDAHGVRSSVQVSVNTQADTASGGASDHRDAPRPPSQQRSNNARQAIPWDVASSPMPVSYVLPVSSRRVDIRI